MYQIEIAKVAQWDLLEAYDFYEMQRAGLGDDLVLCYEEALQVIKRNPFCEIRLDNIRAYNIRRFPYQLFYEIHGERIIVIAFLYGRRDPNTWQSRMI
jgi:hypothetical protein